MSESLNSGPLPGSFIDCRVQRMVLAPRYHYSSIDRPALKSKSHLVAQAIRIRWPQNICVCGVWCVCACASAQIISVSPVFGVFQGCSLFPLFSHYQLLSLSFPSPTFIRTDQSPNMCFMCLSRESGPSSSAGTHIQTWWETHAPFTNTHISYYSSHMQSLFICSTAAH